MKIENRKFYVAMTPESGVMPEDGEALEVTVIYGDMMRGELEGSRLRLPAMKETPMHYTGLWVWAALVRTGVYDRDFKTFQGDLLMIEAAKEAEEVPPTRE